MRRISRWAASHRNSARISIVLAYLLMNVLGFLLGDLLSSFEITVHPLVAYGAVAVFLFSAIFYPRSASEKKAPGGYRKQKSLDIILLSATFLLIITFGNRLCLNGKMLPVASTPSAVYGASVSQLLNPRDPRPINKMESKEFRKKLREHIQRLRKSSRDISKEGKVALSILTILVGIGLILLNAALACDLSCSGNEGAAFAVLLLGTALLIFLMVIIIRRINKGPRIKEENSPAPASG